MEPIEVTERSAPNRDRTVNRGTYHEVVERSCPACGDGPFPLVHGVLQHRCVIVLGEE